jgi:hypothetical protein
MRHQSFVIFVVMLGSVLVAQSPELKGRPADAETLVDRASQSLFASKVEPRTRATEVMRCELLDASAPCRGSDHVSGHLRRHVRAPDAAGLVDGAKNRTVRDVDSPDAQTSHAFDMANACDQLKTQQTRIRRLVRTTVDGC